MLTIGFTLLAAMTWTLGDNPTAPLVWAACVATFAIATTVARHAATDRATRSPQA